MSSFALPTIQMNKTDPGVPSSASATTTAPSHEYGYTEFTSPVTISATTEGSANTIVTATAVVFDGLTTVLIEFDCPEVVINQNASGNKCFVVLFEDGSAIGQLGVIRDDSGNNQISAPFLVGRRMTPASGSRTYSIRAYRTNANATANAGTAGVGNYMPGYIRITKVG